MFPQMTDTGWATQRSFVDPPPLDLTRPALSRIHAHHEPQENQSGTPAWRGDCPGRDRGSAQDRLGFGAGAALDVHTLGRSSSPVTGWGTSC